ncbi:MAG: peptidylprolyl isomerase [Bacteroidota bacterium]|nr:peptidylprolyl isomerase [Bacteroidota bacterium]
MNKKHALFFIALLLIHASLFAQQQPIVIDRVVGVVGNKMIKQSDVESEYQRLKAQGEATDESQKCEIYENLLGQKLMTVQAILDSVKISDTQVEAQLNDRLSNFIAQLGSQEKIEKYFNKSMSEIKEDLRESFREQQMTQEMQRTIVGETKITPTEVENFYNKTSKDSLPKINSQIEYSQITAYPPYTEKSILATKEKLLDLRKQIIEGKSFSALAGVYSEDEGTARRGGETDFLPRSQLDKEYAKAAFALNTPGEISRIVESTFGYHLIQLIEKRGDQINTRHILLKPKADPEAVVKVKGVLDSLARVIRHDSIDFNKAVMYYSMDVDTRFNNGVVVNQATGSTRFDIEQLAPADYYNIKKLKVGEISDPFESRDKNGKIIFKIIMLKSKTEPHTANLKDDYDLIQNIAKNHKRMSVLQDWITEKQRSTYIHVDDSFKNCNFKSKGWVKADL